MIETLSNYKVIPGKTLGLKYCFPGEKQWNPKLGAVSMSPYWDMGEYQDSSCLSVWGQATGILFGHLRWDSPDAVWIASEYDATKAVPYEDGEVWIPEGKTVAVSADPFEVTRFIRSCLPALPVGRILPMFDSQTVGAYQKCSVGDGGIAEAGEEGMVTVGNWGKGRVGKGGVVQVGMHSSAEAGDFGTGFGGDWSHVKAGRRGSVSVGCKGTAEVGDGGTARVGWQGRGRAGVGGNLILSYSMGRFHKTFFVGVNGVKPDVYYSITEEGVLQEEAA